MTNFLSDLKSIDYPMYGILLINIILSPFLLAISFRSAENTTDRQIISKEYDRCIDASEGVTAKILDCNMAERERLDHVLQEAYRDAQKNLPAAQKRRLQRSQTMWLSELPALCDHDPDVQSSKGGTGALLSYSSCLLDERIHRIQWLKQHYGKAHR